MRVLIVEDTVDIAVWLAKALELHDIDARIKVSGFRDLLRPKAWDSITHAVLDAMMPEVSGLEIAKFVKEHHPEIRIVMATGSIIAADEATGLVDRVLLKPFTTEQLVEAIRG